MCTVVFLIFVVCARCFECAAKRWAIHFLGTFDVMHFKRSEYTLTCLHSLYAAQMKSKMLFLKHFVRLFVRLCWATICSVGVVCRCCVPVIVVIVVIAVAVAIVFIPSCYVRFYWWWRWWRQWWLQWCFHSSHLHHHHHHQVFVLPRALRQCTQPTTCRYFTSKRHFECHKRVTLSEKVYKMYLVHCIHQ